MNRLKIFIWLFLVPALAFACSKNKKDSTPVKEPHQLRILGYLFSANNWQNTVNDVDLGQITDMNLAFVNPDATGNFPANDAYRQVIEKAHAKNVRVFFSIGGGDPPPHLAGLLENDKRAALVAGIVSLLDAYAFDGVDVDLENSLINANYASFVNELALAVKPKKKLLTAALASWNSNLISDATLQHYDFINVMAYDKTGPWNLSNPGQHSPFSMAQDDFNYYRSRNVAAEKIFIGLPFYGYGFGSGAPESMTYKSIISTYPGSETGDAVTLPSGGTIYYNGIPTIRQKVAFAKTNKAGGVMIWQLLGDSKDANSLLKAINQEATK